MQLIDKGSWDKNGHRKFRPIAMSSVIFRQIALEGLRRVLPSVEYRQRLSLDFKDTPITADKGSLDNENRSADGQLCDTESTDGESSPLKGDAHKDRILTAALSKFQHAVAKSNGLETVVHSLFGFQPSRTNGKKSEPLSPLELVMISLDACDAFQNVFRSAFFGALEKFYPELLPLVRLRYAQGDSIVFGSDGVDHVIHSQSRGVQQGDTLGTFLFSLAVGPAIQAAFEACLEALAEHHDDLERDKLVQMFIMAWFADDSNAILPA